jgi:RNA polymerase sigma factor (sigma-70 family)
MIREYPLVHRCEQTDDVFQKAVLRLCRALRQVSPGSTRDLVRLSAAQVRRELLNLSRYYRSRPDLLGFGDAGLARVSRGSETRVNAPDRARVHSRAEDHALYLDQWTDFHEVVAGLPEPQREVFDLIWYHGLSQQEVASVQGICLRTVKKRWHSARLAIYDALDGILPGA